jgi:hypothetical protein
MLWEDILMLVLIVAQLELVIIVAAIVIVQNVKTRKEKIG